jgi:hypothetical protein
MEMDSLRSKLAFYCCFHSLPLPLTKTPAYYGIRTLRIHSVFLVQAAGAYPKFRRYQKGLVHLKIVPGGSSLFCPCVVKKTV